MIRYALQCEAGHRFDSWFRDSEAFDALAAAKLVTCADCGSSTVSKSLMAPSVQTSRTRSSTLNTETPPSAQAEPVQASLPVLDERTHKLRAMIRVWREDLLSRSTDVGTAFADEARKIHDGAAEQKPIHGVASRDEVRSLLEDGVSVLPLPPCPDDAN